MFHAVGISLYINLTHVGKEVYEVNHAGVVVACPLFAHTDAWACF
jgi:hypothetical protein